MILVKHPDLPKQEHEPVKPNVVNAELSNDMGFLSKLASKVAPKIIKAVAVGGDKDDRQLLREKIDLPVFEPVFQKFGDGVESIVKTGLSIATVGLGSGALTKSIIPTTEKNMNIDWGAVIQGGFDTAIKALGGKGDTSSATTTTSGGGGASPGQPSIMMWVLIGVAAIFLFKKL